MSKSQKSRAADAMESAGFALDRKASLWAYFVLHGLRFLKEGGRMAWLLPGSFIYADYGKIIRELLEKMFGRVLTILLGERLFGDEGSDERTVVLLAEDWRLGPAVRGVEVEHASSLQAFEQIIEGLLDGSWSGKRLHVRSTYSLLSPEGKKCFEDATNHPFAVRLGELAEISIGIVTGSNKFFIINQEIARDWRLPVRALRPVLAKLSIAKGLYVRKRDLEEARARNLRCLLIDTSCQETGGVVARYLASFPRTRRNRILTFKKREVWHQLNDERIPDAFLSYMSQAGPRLVLNGAETTCPNSIHQVFFKNGMPQHIRKIVALSLLSSYSQLSAEIEGRSYGSGVLKHELSESRQLSLHVPDVIDRNTVNSVFAKVDRCLRAGNTVEAQIMADEFLVPHLGESYGWTPINVLRRELSLARQRRVARS